MFYFSLNLSKCNFRYLEAVNVGHNFVTLRWEPGFDGGLHNTKYFVAYKRVTTGRDLAGDCPGAAQPSRRPQGDGLQEFDCQKSNPCNVTALEQHNTFLFKVNVKILFKTSIFKIEKIYFLYKFFREYLGIFVKRLVFLKKLLASYC